MPSLARGWVITTERFEGKVEIKRVGKDIGITIKQTHTSVQTKDVCETAAKVILQSLKKENMISHDAAVNRIKFSDFDNANRILFLKALIQGKTAKELSFLDMRHVGMRPTKDAALPAEIKWMEHRVRSLDMRGESFHDSIFLDQPKMRPFIELYSITANMSFEYVDCKGSCDVFCDFADYSIKEKKDAELYVSISGIRFEEKNDQTKVSSVKERIIGAIEKDKMQLHRNYSGRNT